ncbi:hypothetical protein ES703_100695 [subsurface metagenome]
MNSGISKGWRPIPKTTCEYPASIVMGYIPEWFIRNPGVFPIPDRPSAHSKWGPSNRDMHRAPEIVVRSIIVYPFPPAALFQDIGFVMKRWR